MKNKRVFLILFLLVAIIFFLVVSNSQAITITCNNCPTENNESVVGSAGNYTFTASGCSGTVSWGVTGTGAGINNGTLTTTSACGAITVAAGCSDGSIATKTARVSDAGQWAWISDCGNSYGYCWAITCSGYFTNGKYLYYDGYYCPPYPECFPRDWDALYSPCPSHGEVCSGCKVIWNRIWEWQCPSCSSVDNDHDGSNSCNDCDDTNPNIRPSAQELCADLIDNNCNGQVDEGCAPCVDSDGDGHYAIGSSCTPADDCNDNDNSIYPGAPEKCDGKRNDCSDRPKDEGCKDDPNLWHCTGSAVNMASSNLEHSQALFSIKSAILPIDFELTYNSLDNDGVLGKGWSHPYNIKLIQQSGTEYTLIQSYGKHMTLIQNGSQYKPPTEAYPILAINPDSTYKLTHRDNTVYNFDTSGKLTSIQDRNANSITFAYTGNNLTTITDAAGRVTTIAYNANNKITTITDLRGNTHTFTYTNNFLTGISTQTTDLITKSWSYTYDTDGFILTKTDPLGYVSSYAYDGSHKLTSSTDPEGKIRTPAYNPATTTSTMTERDNGIWTYKYNTTFGSITEKTDPDGNKITYGYDANGNNTSITDSKNQTTTYTYNTNGNILTETDPAAKTTTYTYNSLNQILTITDPLNNITSFTYDVKGNRTSMTDPTGAITSYTYDTKGNITSITNPLTQVTTLTYDTSNNLTSITDHTGAVTSFTYDTSGNILTKTDPNGNITTYEYNGLNQLKKITDHLGNITTIVNDLKGNITSIADALGHVTTYEYNYKGQLKKITDSLGNITQYAYGGTGCASCGGGGDNLVSITDARGKITSFEYDKRGNRLKQTSPTGKIINLAYDSTNLLSSLTYPSNAVTTFNYNSRNLLATKTDPLGMITAFTYDNAGRLSSKTDRKLDMLNYAYTSDNKLSSITYPDTSTVIFTYDLLDRVTTMQDALGTTTYTYDDVNRIVTVTDPNGFVVIHKYDSIGNLLELTYPGNKKVTYTYDQLNRLKTVTNWLNQVATYNYDAAGRLTSLTNFNGTVTTYGYDNANRFVSLENKKSDNSVVATYNYTLNAVGNITQSIQDEPLTPVFNAEVTNYTYNTQKTRLLSAGSDSFTYDAEGQLATGYGSTFTFDYEHRLIAISGEFNATYSYDGLGNRLKAVRSGTTTKYVYDVNGNIIAEADVNNAITKYYVHGLGLMSLITPAGSVYTYHFNNIGSTIAITDGTQNIVNKYSYDPFGVILNQVEAISQPFKYVGQYGVMAEPNGFYYMLTRYLDAKAGIFTSEDTIGFAGGDANLSRYVRNNVVNFIDPFGLHDVHFLDPFFKTLKPTYNRWIITYDDEGIPVNISSGSIDPDPKQKKCKKGCPTVKSGTYDFEQGDFPRTLKRQGQKRYPALLIGTVPTIARNPNNNNASSAKGVWIHKGCQKNRTCAEGCLTIGPDDWEDFMKNFPKGSGGQVTIFGE